MITKFTILFCVAIIGLCSASVSMQQAQADLGLMNFMMQSRSKTQDNPVRSLECFDIYVPQLQAIADKYKEDYKACVDNADEERENIDKLAEPERERLNQTAAESCQALEECSANEDSVSFFDCYADVGSQNVKSMYNISTDAAAELAEVREQYRLIEVSQYRCTNESERAYAENTASTYEALNRCLAGLEPLPTSSSSTTTTTSAPPEETETPEPENPDPENPDPENPDPENPDPENPDPENPEPENPSARSLPFFEGEPNIIERLQDAWNNKDKWIFN